jgi:Ca2+-binding EF-hand superfamily protein
MDSNKDNTLSKAEVKGPLKNDFDTIDLDKDGFISKEEMKKAPKPEGRRPENKD